MIKSFPPNGDLAWGRRGIEIRWDEDRATTSYNLIASAKLNGIDLELDRGTLLAKIASNPVSSVEELMPGASPLPKSKVIRPGQLTCRALDEASDGSAVANCPDSRPQMATFWGGAIVYPDYAIQ